MTPHAAPGLPLSPTSPPLSEHEPTRATHRGTESIPWVLYQLNVAPSSTSFSVWKRGKNSTWKSNLFRLKNISRVFSGIKTLFGKYRRVKSRGFGNSPPPRRFFLEGLFGVYIGLVQHKGTGRVPKVEISRLNRCSREISKAILSRTSSYHLNCISQEKKIHQVIIAEG